VVWRPEWTGGGEGRDGPGKITQGNFSSVILVGGGGIKKRQSSDIKAAKAHWADYKKRKK
jgi:hypothetical protein